MNTTSKIGRFALASLVFAVTLGAMSCDDDSPTNSDGIDDEITWQQTPLDSVTSLDHSLAINSSNHVFVGTLGHGVFRSKDRGETWINILDGFGPRSIVINSEDHIFAAKDQALMRSLDGGQTWELLLILSFSANIRSMVFDKNGILYVGSHVGDEFSGGVLRSDDNGDTWVKTNLPDTLGIWDLVINSDGEILAGTNWGVYRSSDKGASWIPANTGLNDLPVTSLAINPINGDMYVSIDIDALYRSTDNGQTWNPTSLTKPMVTDIVFNSHGHIFAAIGIFGTGTPEGVFYSQDNGESWTQINQGLTNLNVFSLLVDSEDYLYAATARRSGVFRSVNPDSKTVAAMMFTNYSKLFKAKGGDV